MATTTGDDLGFTYRLLGRSEVEVRHQGRLAATLRGVQALDFVAEIEGSDLRSQQQLMARVTGNYKRGNERTAAGHPRNRSGTESR